jgi:hypothetical protein
LAWQEKVCKGNTFFAQNLGIIKLSNSFQLWGRKLQRLWNALSTTASQLCKQSCGESPWREEYGSHAPKQTAIRHHVALKGREHSLFSWFHSEF